MRHTQVFFLFICFVPFLVSSQKKIELTDLNDFKPQSGNWILVGDIEMSRKISSKPKSEEPPKEKKKKRKSKKKTEDIPSVRFTEGIGILYNNQSEEHQDPLVTKEEYGDLILEVDVMMAKNSNSGIYFQGNYEVQLLDSWGVTSSTFSDMGGIYQAWEEGPTYKFAGVAPLQNAAKAPGLWQHLKVHFQAPKFDENGKKIKDARFVEVVLNGVKIHDNISVAVPTRGSFMDKEVAEGSIWLQGDHGKVAFKNFKITPLKESTATISQLTLEGFKGNFKGLEELEGQEPFMSTTESLINIYRLEEADGYGIIYKGDLVIEEEDVYDLDVQFAGGASLYLNEEMVASHNTAYDVGKITHSQRLKPGRYPFELRCIKSAPWHNPVLGLTIKSESTYPKTFHEYVSFPPNTNLQSPIYVEVGGKPKLLRGFLNHLGEETKLTHTIAVGTPSEVHFAYDMNDARLVAIWKGNFIDATSMWRGRGTAAFDPDGATIWLKPGPILVQLKKDEQGSFEQDEASALKCNGYSIDKKDNLPVFNFSSDEGEIVNKLVPDTAANSLNNHLSYKGQPPANSYYSLAQGKVKQLSDGSFAIGDHEYYLEVLSLHTPILTSINGVDRLLVKVDMNEVKYNIAW